MVSIIIINYLQKELLLQCIRSVHNSTSSYPFEIIVVNNSSSQDLSSLSQEFPSLKLLNNENRGFSHANNLAADHAKGKYLLFLNADTIFKNDFLSDLVKRSSKIQFGAIGLKLLNADGSFQLSFWKENTFFNEIKNKEAEKQFAGKDIKYIKTVENTCRDICEVDWVTGASLFIEKESFLKIDGFDERFFLFYEDADLCKRLKNNGRKIYFYPYSEIVHLKGENVNALFADKTYYYSKDAQILYYKIHNSMLERVSLRIYLFTKFFLLLVSTFKKINFKILLRILEINDKGA